MNNLRDAVSAAVEQAIISAPSGGYASQADALAAVRDALRTVPLAGAPSGMAGGDPHTEAYVTPPRANHRHARHARHARRARARLAIRARRPAAQDTRRAR